MRKARLETVCNRFRSIMLLVAWALLLVPGSVADAAIMTIDDFSAPQSGTSYVISLNDPDPLLIKTADAFIMGGERDLLVDVSGVPGPVSSVGVVGGSLYVFGTVGMGASATLQYDGVDADIVGPPAGLVDAMGLGGIDLTGGGTNTGFLLDFLSIEGGSGNTLALSMTVTGPGGSATYAGAIPENPSPSSPFVSFGSFAQTGTFSFSNVSSVTVDLNGAAVPDVDFQLDNILVVPEPYTLAWLALGAVCLVCGRRAKV